MNSCSVEVEFHDFPSFQQKCVLDFRSKIYPDVVCPTTTSDFVNGFDACSFLQDYFKSARCSMNFAPFHSACVLLRRCDRRQIDFTNFV